MEELIVYNKQTDEDKYIVFNIGKESFGIDVSYINTIIEPPAITKVPKSPEYFRGIINVRGEIIPVMSLRRKMSLEDDNFTKSSRILIVDIGEDKYVGVLVDDVKEVLSIPEEDIKHPSPFLKGAKTLIRGVGKKDDDLISICDIEALV